MGFKRLPGADSTKALLKISNQESSREALVLQELDRKKRRLSSHIHNIDSTEIAKDILKNHHYSSDGESKHLRKVHSSKNLSVLTVTG